MNQQEQILPIGVFMDLDRSGPIPLYFQVAQKIESAIMAGDLPAGSRLENEVSLGERLGLSRPTVRRAIQDLVDKGLLVRRRGIGTQVVHGNKTQVLNLGSIYEDLERNGREPSTKLLKYEVAYADSTLADRLGVEKRSSVLHIKRIRFANKKPLTLMENWLPAEFTNITEPELSKYGLYQILRLRGITIQISKQTIGARMPNSEERSLLNLDSSSAVLTMHGIAYNNAGHAIDYGTHVFNPALYSVDVTVVGK